MSSDLLTASPQHVPRITNNDIRAVNGPELTTSKEDPRFSSCDKNSLDCESQTGDQIKSPSLTASSDTDTLASELSKNSKITSSSPDSKIKSSGTSNGSSGGAGVQQEIFLASVYNEIEDSGKFI